MIIFLYGPDGFRMREKLKGLKDRFINEVDKSGLNLTELEAGKMSINDLSKAIGTQSFLASKRMLVVRDLFKARKALQTEVFEFFKEKDLRDKADDTVVIVVDEKPDKRSGLYKYLAGGKFSQEFESLDARGLVQWIIKRVDERGGRISMSNANLLASKSDGNLWALSGEIDKVLAMNKGSEISREIIEESYLSKIDDNVFNLTDAIANKDKRKALSLVEEQLSSGVNGIYLLSMITRQFRIISMIKSELVNGGESKQGIASKLKLHPFVVQKGMVQAEKYTMPELKNVYSRLVGADKDLKRGVSEKVVIEKLILDI